MVRCYELLLQMALSAPAEEGLRVAAPASAGLSLPLPWPGSTTCHLCDPLHVLHPNADCLEEPNVLFYTRVW